MRWPVSSCSSRWPRAVAHHQRRARRLSTRERPPARLASPNCCGSLRHWLVAASSTVLIVPAARLRFGSGRLLELFATQKLLRSKQQHNSGPAGSTSSVSRGRATMLRSRDSSTSIRCRSRRSATTPVPSSLASVSWPSQPSWWSTRTVTPRFCSAHWMTSNFKPHWRKLPLPEWVV